MSCARHQPPNQLLDQPSSSATNVLPKLKAGSDIWAVRCKSLSLLAIIAVIFPEQRDQAGYVTGLISTQSRLLFNYRLPQVKKTQPLSPSENTLGFGLR